MFEYVGGREGAWHMFSRKWEEGRWVVFSREYGAGKGGGGSSVGDLPQLGLNKKIDSPCCGNSLIHQPSSCRETFPGGRG